MKAGDPVHWKSAEYNGVVCACVNGKALVQFIGASHGSTWVAEQELTPGWASSVYWDADYWDVKEVKARAEKMSSK